MTAQRPDSTTQSDPLSVRCRKCGRQVRPRRTCYVCNLETPAPFADRPDLVTKIVNAAWSARRSLGRAA